MTEQEQKAVQAIAEIEAKLAPLNRDLEAAKQRLAEAKEPVLRHGSVCVGESGWIVKPIESFEVSDGEGSLKFSIDIDGDVEVVTDTGKYTTIYKSEIPDVIRGLQGIQLKQK